MRLHRRRLSMLGCLVVLLVSHGSVRAADLPAGLPHYEVHMDVDVAGHAVRGMVRATWTNRSKHPVGELVFNAHARYVVPDSEVGVVAKTLEILRINPSDAMGITEPPLDIVNIQLVDATGRTGAALPFQYEGDTLTTLVVKLPEPLAPGASATVQLDFTFTLPQKMGRWGQWAGVTYLSHWLPVFAVHDDTGSAPSPGCACSARGWQPTPFIPWHQPFFNESASYRVHAVVPACEEVASTGTVVAEARADDGRRELTIEAIGVRDFAFLCSQRFQRFEGEVQVGPGVPQPIRVHVLAFKEHAHYAKRMVEIACESLAIYSQWFGPYPYPDFTIAESYFGWNGNECSTLVMIDERIFDMPHLADGFVEYLIAHEICHQWWYNLIGTNGYCETFMDEAMAVHFSHRFLNQKRGRNNAMLKYPKGLGWLPNIRRDDYRFSGLYGTIGRGEHGPVVQEMPQFGHVINLFSMSYDKGSRVVAMIEERLGEAAFMDFTRRIALRYRYRILRVADFRRELEAYTGTSWETFFDDWLFGKGLTDWKVRKVETQPPAHCRAPCLLSRLRGRRCRSPVASPDDDPQMRSAWRVTVILEQKAELCEQTTLGFEIPGCEGYSIRLPIIPQAKAYHVDNPPADVTVEDDCRIRVVVYLPDEPTQIAVDPDQVLVDREPANNFWKPRCNFRLTPLYTFLDEMDLTNSHDRWNVTAGPWIYGTAYDEVWYPRSTMIGFRAGAYRTQKFWGGVYGAYRTDFRDVVVGADGLSDHWYDGKVQFGFNAERRLTTFYDGDDHASRGVLFSRYIFMYGSSFYLQPAHYIEGFASFQNNFLPFEKDPTPVGERYTRQSTLGLHYRLNYLTPYWDPEGGYSIDLTYQGGLAELDRRQGVQLFSAQAAAVKYLPDLTGALEPLPALRDAARPALLWLADTRLAVRLYGAIGLPSRGEFFTMGGGALLRGFDLAERQGSAVWVASAEWRVPIAKHLTWDCLDHTVALRNIYTAFFYDVGDAYTSGQAVGPIAHSVGAGLRLDVGWFAFVERSMLRFDVAKTVNADTVPQFWFGIQQPF